MREAGVLFVSIAILGGCLAAPQELEAAAAEIASTPEPGILAAPRLLTIPAGSSYSLVWLNATEEDWVDWDEDHKMLNLAYEAQDDVDLDGMSVQFLRVEGSTLDGRGSHLSSGAGSGSSGQTGEPEPVTSIVAISVANAARPFDVLLGADEWLDFELEGEPVPASVIDQGFYEGFAIYFEFGSVFSFVFGGEPWTVGAKVEDTRIHPPVGSNAIGAAGTLRASFEHALDGPGIHSAYFFAAAFQGARVGQWSYSFTSDGETQELGGLYAEPLPLTPFVFAAAAPESAVSAEIVMDAVAEVFPITVFGATTVPWDPSSVGLTFEPRFRSYGLLPVIHTPEGCLGAGQGSPSWRDCAALT